MSEEMRMNMLWATKQEEIDRLKTEIDRLEAENYRLGVKLQAAWLREEIKEKETTFTITKQDRICEEANACVGHQWILNGKWVFARLREVFEFITDRWPE